MAYILLLTMIKRKQMALYNDRKQMYLEIIQ